MRHLITGGAGFIGSHVADVLARRGDAVIVLDDLSTGRRENLESAVAGGRVEFVEGSTCDQALVDELMARADNCFHLASVVGVRMIVDHAYESLLNNVRGCDYVMHAAARHRVPLLFTSTSEIYGKDSEGALSEDSDRVLGPPQLRRWSYATANAFGEALAFGLCEDLGARIKVARLFNTTGPRQIGTHGMVVPRFVSQALAGSNLTVYGDGSQSRCFAHVRDVSRAIVMLGDCEEAAGKPFNVGARREITILQLARLVIERSGSDSEIEFVGFDEAYGAGFEELGRRQPDTAAIADLLGWTAELEVDQAIDDMIAFERSRAYERRAVMDTNGHRAAVGSEERSSVA